MAFDPPKPGQVIGYRYLWWGEHRKGQEEGAKDRPCAVAYAIENASGKTRVYVLPITHTKPFKSEDGMEMLPQWKQHLGLDDQPSPIITSELNHFEAGAGYLPQRHGRDFLRFPALQGDNTPSRNGSRKGREKEHHRCRPGLRPAQGAQ